MPIATMDLTVLDTPEPRRLAEFYCAVLGWQVTDDQDDWVTIRAAGGGPGGLAFQLSPDHVAPTWPDPTVPQQFHLDLTVPDIDPAEAQVLALGAKETGVRGDRDNFRAYLDPSGHPFCLCRG